MKKGITVFVSLQRDNKGAIPASNGIYARRGLGRVLSPTLFSPGRVKTIKTIKRAVTSFQVTGENHHQL